MPDPSPAAVVLDGEATGGGRLLGTAGALARGTALGFSLLLAMPLATGCLYWMRAPVARVPGPGVAEALELDSLAQHARVPLLAYLVVYGLVYSLVGLVARWTRLDRLRAALVMAVTTGLLTFVLDAFSIYVVRQVGYGQAFAESAHAQPVYLNALLAGLAGAFIARQRAARSRPAALLAFAVGLTGIMELVSAVVPRFADRLAGLDGFAPTPTPPLANALVVPLGIVLLLTSKALSRGSRRAWGIAVVVLAASCALHVVDSYDYDTAVVCGTILLALLARRRDFTSKGAPGTRPSAALRLLLGVVSAYLYAFVALLIDRSALGLPMHLARAASVAAEALVGLPRHPSGYAGRGGADWFYWSVESVVAIGVGWAAATWLAPWRHLLFRSEARRERAAEVVRRYGTDTLAPFALRADKALFFFAVAGSAGGSEEVVVPYRVVRGVALVSGDPIGPDEGVEPAFSSFLAQARERSWKVAVLGSSGRWLDMYRRAGLRAMYQGDEAQVLTGGFNLDKPGMKTVRQAVHRVERAGYHCEVVFAGEVTTDLAAELAEVERLWLGGARRTGFVMELDDLFRLTGKDAVFVIARAPDGGIGGFLHAAACPASGALSLSSLPRRRDTPNGLAAWLVTQAILWADEHGFGVLSLNFAPFAGLLGDDEELSTLQHIEREALLALKKRLSLQLDNLMRFNQRLGPRLQPRYLVYERRSDLPRVAVAAMAAEGYLPFADLVRGRFWPGTAGDPDEGGRATVRGRQRAAAALDGGNGTESRDESAEVARPDGAAEVARPDGGAEVARPDEAEHRDGGGEPEAEVLPV